MARLVCVTGATGNQGGSVAKLLLQHPDDYRVRAITRRPKCLAAIALRDLGAEIVQADLNLEDEVNPAFKGCWGVFGVTSSYDPAVTANPALEEEQGRIMARAALEAGVQCFVWSTLPSAKKMSVDGVNAFIYESKHRVDGYIRDIGLPAALVLTGTFFENFIYRKHVAYLKETDSFEFRHPVILGTTKFHMLWVERDLAAICKHIFDLWDSKKTELNHQYFFAANGHWSYDETVAMIEKVTGKACLYVKQETSGFPERDKIFDMYNKLGTTYPGFTSPDPEVLKLGVKPGSLEDFLRERLMPSLDLS